MSSILNIALSGVRASSLRIENSANNIVNAQSTNTVIQEGKAVNQVFIPRDVVQLPDPNGGTIAFTVESDKKPLTSFNQQDGIIQIPNVDIAEELAKINQASTIYKGNLKVVSQASVLQGRLLDIRA